MLAATKKRASPGNRSLPTPREVTGRFRGLGAAGTAGDHGQVQGTGSLFVCFLVCLFFVCVCLLFICLCVCLFVFVFLPFFLLFGGVGGLLKFG